MFGVALKGLAAEAAVVASAVVALVSLTADSSWAGESAPSSRQMAQNASRVNEVLGVPLSTATWALLGMLLIVAALVITAQSRHQVLAVLQAQAQGELPAQAQGDQVQGVGDRAVRGVKASDYGDPLGAALAIPAVS